MDRWAREEDDGAGMHDARPLEVWMEDEQEATIDFDEGAGEAVNAMETEAQKAADVDGARSQAAAGNIT